MLKHIFIKYTVFSLILLAFAACSKEENPRPDEEPETYAQTLLVFMIASNNLTSASQDDLGEIARGMAEMPETSDVLVYYTSLSQDDGPLLYRVEHDGSLQVLCRYDSEMSSLSPARIARVCSDMQKFSVAQSYNLVLWSHADGWLPSANPVDPLSFGSDYKKNIDIDVLADAIPSGLFDFIWCDCCYLSSIEVIYQMRHKCRWFIASPTPLVSCGMPYHLTLPYLVPEPEKLAEAARLSYPAILSFLPGGGYTIAITDMNEIEGVAAAARDIFTRHVTVAASGLQSYSSDGIGPFYDFLQYSARVAEAAGVPESIGPLKQAMERAVIFKLASPRFFKLTISPEHYSGVSVHRYSGVEDERERYYRTLDWYKAVYVP